MQLGGPEILLAEAGHGGPECTGLWMQSRIVDRDQHHHDLWRAAKDLSRGGDSTHSRHHDIHENGFGRQASGGVNRLFPGAGHPGYRETRRSIDQIPERFPKGAVVVDDQDRNVARR